MSERLTERNANGTAKSRKSPKSSYMGTVYEEMAEIQTEILDRLCDLEDKIEQGKILELPCKVGEIVYVIEPLWYGIWGDYEHKCRKCEHFYEGGMGDNADCSLGKNCCYHIVEEETDLRKIADWITPSSFTKEIAWEKTVFLDRASAKAKVREMKGDNNEQR